MRRSTFSKFFRALRKNIALIVLLFVASSSHAEQIVRGPYLQRLGTNTVTIRWRSDIAVDSRVRFGTSLTTLDSISTLASTSRDHEIVLQGLTSSTRYYYTIGSSGREFGPLASQYFVTAPNSQAQSVRIWAFGDGGVSGRLTTSDPNQIAVANAYQMLTGSKHTDVWLMLGDNAYSSGNDAEYQKGVFDIYQDFLPSVALWPTRGNHDVLHSGGDYFSIFTLPTAGEAGGFASQTEAFYSFNYGPVHFICLNSEQADSSIRANMLAWLQQDLESNDRHWTIAYWHHPPYTKGSHDSDNDGDSEGKMGWMRANVLPLLEAGGVDLVLNGHSHAYERSYLLDGHYGISATLLPSMLVNENSGSAASGGYQKPVLGFNSHKGTVYAVVGTGGQTTSGALNHPVMYTSQLSLGSLVIEVNGNRLVATFFNQENAALDSFLLLKNPTFPVAPEGLQVSDGSPKITAQWQPVSGATYRLYRSIDPFVRGALVADGISDTRYVDQAAEEDRHYFYSVAAVNQVGEGPFSDADEGFWHDPDSDGDGVRDSEDECPELATQHLAGECGCGKPVLGHNALQQPLCTALTLRKTIPSRVVVTRQHAGALSVRADKWVRDRTRYLVTLRSSRGVKRYHFNSARFRFHHLSPGRYQIRYQIFSYNGRTRSHSSYSAATKVTIAH